MDTKINVYILSTFLKLHNVLIIFKVISAPSVLPRRRNLPWKSTIYENHVENAPPYIVDAPGDVTTLANKHYGLCDSNKLLYKRCAKSMGKPKIRPPLLPHFSTDLSETQNQKRYPGYNPACTIWLMWDDGKRVCENGEFWLTFGSFFFCILCVTYRSHRRTDQ